MKRLDNFYSLKNHPWLHKSFSKLRAEELAICLNFIKENEHLERSEFELKVNRLFLDSTHRPKNFTRIQELLSCCNRESV